MSQKFINCKSITLSRGFFKQSLGIMGSKVFTLEKIQIKFGFLLTKSYLCTYGRRYSRSKEKINEFILFFARLIVPLSPISENH